MKKVKNALNVKALVSSMFNIIWAIGASVTAAPLSARNHFLKL
ncbi:hypothetical protein ACFL5P_00445 [candidate division KSB1 bacterium]